MKPVPPTVDQIGRRVLTASSNQEPCASRGSFVIDHRGEAACVLRLSPAVDVRDGTAGKDKEGGQVWEGKQGFSHTSGKQCWSEACQDVPGGVETKYESVRSGMFVF